MNNTRHLLLALCIVSMPKSYGMSRVKNATSRVGIWRLRANGVSRIEGCHPTKAPSATKMHLKEWYNETVVSHFKKPTFSRSAHWVLRRFYDVEAHAARERYIHLLKELIIQEQSLNNSHDIFYHGTSCIGPMLLRKYLWYPDHEKAVLFRDPGDCQHIE